MHEIKAFQCDYCNKYYKHKSSAKRHENRCYKNPKNKACLTCGNFRYDDYCDYSGKSFTDESAINRQEFQSNCKHWIKIIPEVEEEIGEDW